MSKPDMYLCTETKVISNEGHSLVSQTRWAQIDDCIQVLFHNTACPHYKRGVLYSMCCSICRQGELAFNEHVASQTHRGASISFAFHHFSVIDD